MRLIFGSVELWMFLITAIVYLLIPIIFFKFNVKKNGNGLIDQFINKLNDWDFEEDLGEEDEEDFGLLTFYKKLRNYLKKIFISISGIKVVSENLKDSIDSISSNATSISEISDGIAAGAILQAEEVEICSTLSEELGIKTEEMSNMSNGLIDETEKLRNISDIGNKNINELMYNNKELYEVIEGIIKQVNKLVEQASQITKITGIMYGISDQTNLLALNASIEAARAGKVGRSFAVVAEEIRKLSQNSRKSSTDIDELINNIVTSLNIMKGTLDNSEETFKKQNHSVKAATDSFENINNFIGVFINRQSEFGENFNTFMQSRDVLSTSIETIAAVAQESAATTEELASLVMAQESSFNALEDLTSSLQNDIDKVDEYSKDIKITRISTSKKKFAIITDSSSEFWDPLKKNAYKTAKIYNSDVEIFEAGDRQHCTSNQIKFLNEILVRGYDGIAISPINDKKVVELLNRAVNKGIKVVFINSQLEGVDGLGLYETNGINAGKSAAEVAAKMIGKKGSIILGKWNDIHIEAINKRADGFIQGISKYDNIDLNVVSIPADPTEEEAEEIIKTMVQKYPDTDLFYSTNVDWAVHYARYFKKHGLNKKLITIDFIMSLRKEVEEGIINTCMSQRPFVWGEKAIKALNDACAGREVEKYSDTGTFEINKNNIDVFIKRFE